MRHPHNAKRHGRTILLTLVVLFGGGIALLWGWNTFAVELLSQPAMKFKHALALELLLLCVAAAFPLTWRLFGTRTE